MDGFDVRPFLGFKGMESKNYYVFSMIVSEVVRARFACIANDAHIKEPAFCTCHCTGAFSCEDCSGAAPQSSTLSMLTPRLTRLL